MSQKISQTTSPAIELKQVSKSFVTVHKPVQVLKNVSLQVNLGDFLVIFGPSGCGKSTLLHIILGLEPPTKGSLIKVLGKHIYSGLPFGHNNFDEDDAAGFRKEHIGMVYQQTYWIKSQNVLQNVAFPLLLLGVDKTEAYQLSQEILKSLNMLDWAEYVPTELSSGQQQKVNLARALISNPEIIIADEPTGNLDFQAGQELMNILVKLNETGKTIVMVTHDLEYLTYAGRAVEMLDGEIIGVYQGAEKDKISSRRKTKKKSITA